MSVGSFGTDKDVEELARRARKAGWTVQVDGGNHLRWSSPFGQEFRSALTGGRGQRKRVEHRLAAMDPASFADLAPAVARRATNLHNPDSVEVTATLELNACAAELDAVLELIDELASSEPRTINQLISAADCIRDGRAVLRDAEDLLRDIVRRTPRPGG